MKQFKIKEMKNYLMGIALAGMIYSTYGCTNSTNKNVATETPATEQEQTKSPRFENAKVNEVYQHYIHLKTALINNDAKEADMGAKMLATAIKDANITTATKSTDAMLTAKDVKAKRAQLTALSNQLADAFRKEKLASGMIYKQYCPMANDGKGGFWLASESKIKNPYYGNDMLSCGSVEEKIK